MKTPSETAELVTLTDASVERGNRRLWENLNMSVKAGEFIAILGPNGAGKTTLLKVLLGLVPLSTGSAQVLGKPAKRGNQRVGYIPQQQKFDPGLPIRGRDLVRFGVNGFRYGLGGNRAAASRVNSAIAAVQAGAYADKPIGLLSGGEQQRLRIAQALVSEPELLLCDEPLLSLDLSAQASVVQLINEYRQRRQAAVLFVTHEINPVLQHVDRVLYMANGKWVIDTPDAVLQAKTLSKLYGTPVDVLRLKQRILVVGAEDLSVAEHGHHEGHV